MSYDITNSADAECVSDSWHQIATLNIDNFEYSYDDSGFYAGAALLITLTATGTSATSETVLDEFDVVLVEYLGTSEVFGCSEDSTVTLGSPTTNLEVVDPADAKAYRGLQTKTRSGATCQAWTGQTTHDVSDSTLGLSSNYCRSPSDSTWIWCYTTNTYDTWEWCDPLKEHPVYHSGSPVEGIKAKTYSGFNIPWVEEKFGQQNFRVLRETKF